MKKAAAKKAPAKKDMMDRKKEMKKSKDKMGACMK